MQAFSLASSTQKYLQIQKLTVKLFHWSNITTVSLLPNDYLVLFQYFILDYTYTYFNL